MRLGTVVRSRECLRGRDGSTLTKSWWEASNRGKVAVRPFTLSGRRPRSGWRPGPRAKRCGPTGAEFESFYRIISSMSVK